MTKEGKGTAVIEEVTPTLTLPRQVGGKNKGDVPSRGRGDKVLSAKAEVMDPECATSCGAWASA